MKNYNYNPWTDDMQTRMMELIESFGIEKKINRHKEQTLCLSAKSKERLKSIADMMNREFKTTLSFSSISNRYNKSLATAEQKAAMKARRRAYEAKQKELNKQSADEKTELPAETPSATNTRIADVIIKCGRLVKEDKMSPEELCNLIDAL